MDHCCENNLWDCYSEKKPNACMYFIFVHNTKTIGWSCKGNEFVITHTFQRQHACNRYCVQWPGQDNIYGRACDHKIVGMFPQNISESNIHFGAISNSAFAPFNHIKFIIVLLIIHDFRGEY